MVPKIWSTTDRNFCHSGPCFALSPPMDPENQNFEKMKTKPEDILILQMCIINDSHMMYSSGDNGMQQTDFVSFWTIFCTFTP